MTKAKVMFAPGMAEAIAGNAELQEAIKKFELNAQAAFEAVERGEYETWDDAMEAIHGERPLKLDKDAIEHAIEAMSHSDAPRPPIEDMRAMPIGKPERLRITGSITSREDDTYAVEVSFENIQSMERARAISDWVKRMIDRHGDFGQLVAGGDDDDEDGEGTNGGTRQ